VEEDNKALLVIVNKRLLIDQILAVWLVLSHLALVVLPKKTQDFQEESISLPALTLDRRLLATLEL